MSNSERPMRRKLPLNAIERTVDAVIKKKERELLLIEVSLATANRALDAYMRHREVIDPKYLDELQKRVETLAGQFDTCHNELEELFKISRNKTKRDSRMIH